MAAPEKQGVGIQKPRSGLRHHATSGNRAETSIFFTKRALLQNEALDGVSTLRIDQKNPLTSSEIEVAHTATNILPHRTGSKTLNAGAMQRTVAYGIVEGIRMAQVSVMTPTFGRAKFLKETRTFFLAQTFRDIEWMVLDDSPEPNPEFSDQGDGRIKYFHSPNRMTLGEKRNRLVEASAGEIIVHFDDDDYYSPNYVEDVVTKLRAKDVLLLNGFFIAPLNLDCFGYYLTLVKRGLGFAFGKNGNDISVVALEKLNIPWIHFAWGFSYAYRRKVWKKCLFPKIGTEDKAFVMQAIEKNFKVGYHQDLHANTVHTVHALATSRCLSQFIIPPFMLQNLNKDAFDAVGRLREVYRTESAARQHRDAPGAFTEGPESRQAPPL